MIEVVPFAWQYYIIHVHLNGMKSADAKIGQKCLPRYPRLGCDDVYIHVALASVLELVCCDLLRYTEKCAAVTMKCHTVLVWYLVSC